MAKDNETILKLHQGMVSVEQMPENQYVVIHDYDVEGHDPEELHVDEIGGWYLYKRLYADGSEEVIRPATGRSAADQLAAEASAGLHK